MENPCENGYDRKWYAHVLDIHFCGEDCPYLCKEYERYKQEKKGETTMTKENMHKHLSENRSEFKEYSDEEIDYVLEQWQKEEIDKDGEAD